MEQRKNLEARFGQESPEPQDESLIDAEPHGESAKAHYHPSHDPALVTDDEIPW